MHKQKAKEILVIGAGGHAKVLIDCAKSLGLKVIGCLDTNKNVGETSLGKVSVIGNDEYIHNFNPENIALVNGIGSTRDTRLRCEIFKKYSEKGYIFKTLIHPTAFVSPYAKLGEGSVVLAGAVVGTNATIGQNVIVNTKASIDHDCKVGNHCHVAPGATLSGSVYVGNNVHIGTGANIINNCKIRDGFLVKAGQLITGDV